MRSTISLTSALDALGSDDVGAMSDPELRGQLSALLAAVNRLNAELSRRAEAFDRRCLSGDDACRTTAAWLRRFGRLSGHAASGLVKRARLSRQLPALAAAASAGRVSVEHIDRVVRLADRVGLSTAVEAEPVLTPLAVAGDPTELGQACDQIVAHVDPDGVQPDAGKDFHRRGITLSPFDGMMVVRGQLDPEGGAALATALDAVMAPPGDGDRRSPDQRRADALVDLARGALREGRVPTIGGVRPQVAVLLTPQNLMDRSRRAPAQVLDCRADAPTLPAPAPQPAPTTGHDGTGSANTPGLTVIPGPTARPGPTAIPRLAHLEWVGAVPDVVAQRIACDADVWRVILDPASGRPLDVGRTHRLVPHWLRKALHARDRGCRFPGCHTPVAWTDAHHVVAWADGGPTDLDNLILVCRYHHGLVHEGGWTIHLNTTAGTVTAARPDGRPYETTIRGPSLTEGAA